MADKPLSNSSPIALGLAIVACVGVAGAGVAWGDSRSRLNAVESNAAKAEARIQKAEEATNAHAVRDAALETKVGNIQETVQRMDGKLDRALERRGIQNARDER